jgi:hypothetical protein
VARHRPFTPAQQRQNAAFLAALRRTGNVRLACRTLGVPRATYTRRRKTCAAFATEWDMVLTAAHAAFQLAGGERMPESPGTVTRNCPHSRDNPPSNLRTQVTGWSGAREVKVAWHPGRALFGGWRIDDWKKRRRA